MSTGQTYLLGAIAGLTIFLGLPMGRMQGLSPQVKAFFTATATGNERLLHQHGQIGHGPPLWAAALLFVVAWQAMLVAMM